MRISVDLPEIDLTGLAEAAKREVLGAVKVGVNLIANDAKRSIARGSKTGRIYRRHGIEHQASAPGEPPATDTGMLIASIVADAVLEGDEIAGFVDARAEYAVHLEYGTRKMAARPFLIPAVELNRARVGELIAAALQRATR